MFEGFGMKDGPSLLGRKNRRQDMGPGYEASETNRLWKPARLAKVWKPLRVEGRVQPYQDFPGISMTLPAFSRRAGDALKDFLKPNGELLPLISDRGEYYFYNITTVIDALDVAKSKCTFWCDPPTTAVDIDYFAFHKRKLVGASIFRIIEMPIYTIVTQAFVERVNELGLNGFHFIKIWPFPPRTHWRDAAKRKDRTRKIAERGLKQHTLVVVLPLAGKKPSPAERKRIKRLEDDLDAQLAIRSLTAPFFGIYEGSDNLNNEFRLFASCPDVKKLVQKLRPWLEALDWGRRVRIVMRFGEMYDEDSKEETVEIR
jgi:hypothetical protein